jgi:hypothetical protein
MFIAQFIATPLGVDPILVKLHHILCLDVFQHEGVIHRG